jgi:hypothetical protein
MAVRVGVQSQQWEGLGPKDIRLAMSSIMKRQLNTSPVISRPFAETSDPAFVLLMHFAGYQLDEDVDQKRCDVEDHEAHGEIVFSPG